MSTTDHAKRPPLAVVILAAGLGTRMKSDVPKVLHEVCGRPMLSYVIDAALSVSPERIVVVTGPEQEAIATILPVGCERAVQQERRGTGDAVRAGLEPLHDFEGDVMVLVRRRAAGRRRLRRRPPPAAPSTPKPPPRSPPRSSTTRLTTAASCATLREGSCASSSIGTPTGDEAADRRDQRRPVRVPQRRAAPGPPAPRQRQRAGRAVPHRRRPSAARRRAQPVAGLQSDDEEMCMGVNSRVELAVVNAAMRRRLARAADARRRHRRGSRHDLRRLGRRGRARHPRSAPTRTCSAAPPSARPARSAPAASCATPSSATAPGSSARISTSASSAPAAASGRSPTSAPTRCSPRAPGPARSSRSRTAASARAARCRT